MESKIYQDLQIILKNQRSLLNITQEELSERSGIGLRFIREVEQGTKKTMRMDKVVELLSFFGLSLIITRDEK